MNLFTEALPHWLVHPVVLRLALTAVVLIAVFVLTRLAQRLVKRSIHDKDARYRARKATSFVAYALAILVVAMSYSDRLGSMTIALGVVGASLAFALQEVISSVAGWLALSIGSFYRPGDRVQLGGVKGDVIDVGMLRTTLMEVGQWVNADLYNGRIVRVANSFVFKEPVVNYSADFPFLWDEIVFPVRYGSDWAYTREVLQSVAQELVGDYARQSTLAWKDVVMKYRIEDAKVEPVVTLQADQNWIEFTLRYIVDYRKRRSTRDALFTRILQEVDRSQGRINIATAGFEVLGAPALDVNVRSSEKSDPRR